MKDMYPDPYDFIPSDYYPGFPEEKSDEFENERNKKQTKE